MSDTTYFEIHAIGKIQRSGENVEILVDKKYRPALKQLDQFSHVLVSWWADKMADEKWRNTITCNPPYAPDHETGVFACRAQYRPNPIAITLCEIKSVDIENGVVEVVNIDAYDGTPLIDLKAFFPVTDRPQKAHIPDYLKGWPEWFPTEGIGIME